MPQWQERWTEERPRWGTYSVKAHQDLERLITDLLTYDVLVFPCPDDDAEYERWQRQGWDPELLAHRVTQLGDHAVVTPWAPELRNAWQHAWERLEPDDRQDPEAAFMLTAATMADLPLSTLMGEEDDRFGVAVREQPRVHSAFEGSSGRARATAEPVELVTVVQSQREAYALTGSGGAAGRPRPVPYGANADGIRLRVRLRAPATADEATLLRTLDLIEDDDFSRARRRLWAWESTLRPGADARDVEAGLSALVEDYNAVLRRERIATRATWVFLIVPTLAGIGVDAVTTGLGGTLANAATAFVIDKVKARFPSMKGKAARASHHPGSAVAGMCAIGGPALPPAGD